MSERIRILFESTQTPILSVYYTAGFPKLDDTVPIAVELERAGVDMIELGIPFSDPVADGPVIQESSTAALKNGMTVPLLLDQLKELRSRVKMPVVLMGYINPVLQYGMEKFCADASAAGADGLIIPDLPLDELEGEYQSLFARHGLSFILLVSPTTSEERLRRIDSLTTGFIYAVSSSSTTGARNGFTGEQEQYFRRLAASGLKHPFLIGFGISNRQTFQAAVQYAKGAIIGSAFVSLLRDKPATADHIQAFVDEIKLAR